MSDGRKCLVAFVCGILAGIMTACYARWVTIKFPGQAAKIVHQASPDASK